jgi:membrane protein
MAGAVVRVVEYVREILRRVGETELVDRAYTIAASTFVGLLPLLLLATGAFATPGEASPVANQIITRLGLEGVAANAVRVLLPAQRSGFYWFGVLVILYSLFSLSRRAARAYSAIWQVPQLRIDQQWRGLVWILLELASIVSLAWLRDPLPSAGTTGRVLIVAGATLLWFGTEMLAQRLLTSGAVPWRRIAVAAALVSVGRVGVAMWVSVYVASSVARQAETYGPVGVVFALFTSLFASVAVTLGATMLGAVLTTPRGAIDVAAPEVAA